MGAHVGGLDVVPLLGAIARCHVVRGHGKVPLLCDIGVGAHVGGLDVVPLLGAIGWVHTLADWTGCLCWAPCGKVPW